MSLTTAEAWGVTIAGVLGLVLAVNQLGVDIPSALGTALRGTEAVLNHSLA